MTQTVRTTPLLALAAAIAMSLAAASAFAQDAAPQPAPMQTDSAAPAKTAWEDLDINKDGNLSKEESGAAPALKDVFEKADANADGALTGDEYRTYLAANNPEQGKPAHGKKK
jgi:Ca2+-binding EF-hand superfamily protein